MIRPKYGSATREEAAVLMDGSISKPSATESLRVSGADQRARSAGAMQRPDAAAGILLSGARPGSWQSYLDLTDSVTTERLRVGATAGATVNLYRVDATITTNEQLGGIVFSASLDAGVSTASGARVEGQAAETWTATEKGTNIVFFTVAIGGAVISAKAQIVADGGMHIGTSLTAPPVGGLRTEGGIVIEAGGLSILGGGFTIVGDLSLDGDLAFVGPQAITTSSGNLVLNPTGQLIVNTTADKGSQEIQVGGGGGSASILLYHDGSSILSTGALGVVQFGGDETGSDFHLAALVGGEASQNWTSSAKGTHITFHTTNSGTESSSEKMKLADDGGLHIGTGFTTPPAGGLRTEGQIIVEASGLTVTGAFSLDGDLDFTGPQEISTTTGDLTLNPASDVNIDADINFTGAQSILTTSGTLSLSPSGDLRLKNGQNFIGGTTNANMAVGLTIQQGANDDEIIAFKASEVSHSGPTEADTFGMVQKSEATSGGMQVTGFKDSGGANSQAAVVEAYLSENANTTKSTSGRGIVEIRGFQSSGGSVANTVANGNVFAIRTRVGGSELTRWILDEDGDTWQSGDIICTNIAATVTTATQNSITTMTGLVTVGALNSGSITSGFGNIDNGSSTLDTGAFTATTGDFTGLVRVAHAGDLIVALNDTSATGSPFLGFEQDGTRRSFVQHLDAGDRLRLVSEYGSLALETGTSGTEVVRLIVSSAGAFDFQSNTVAMGALTLSNFSSTAVSEGAVDSGGSGFKLLRVPN